MAPCKTQDFYTKKRGMCMHATLRRRLDYRYVAPVKTTLPCTVSVSTQLHGKRLNNRDKPPLPLPAVGAPPIPRRDPPKTNRSPSNSSPDHAKTRRNQPQFLPPKSVGHTMCTLLCMLNVPDVYWVHSTPGRRLCTLLYQVCMYTPCLLRVHCR